jgi:hypothetical protein
MKASLLRKADRIAKERAPKRRMHHFWWEQDETREAVRIRAAIASGEASRGDCFVIYTWTRPEGEGTGG